MKFLIILFVLNLICVLNANKNITDFDKAETRTYMETALFDLINKVNENSIQLIKSRIYIEKLETAVNVSQEHVNQLKADVTKSQENVKLVETKLKSEIDRAKQEINSLKNQNINLSNELKGFIFYTF